MADFNYNAMAQPAGGGYPFGAPMGGQMPPGVFPQIGGSSALGMIAPMLIPMISESLRPMLNALTMTFMSQMNAMNGLQQRWMMELTGTLRQAVDPQASGLLRQSIAGMYTIGGGDAQKDAAMLQRFSDRMHPILTTLIPMMPALDALYGSQGNAAVGASMWAEASRYMTAGGRPATRIDERDAITGALKPLAERGGFDIAAMSSATHAALNASGRFANAGFRPFEAAQLITSLQTQGLTGLQFGGKDPAQVGKEAAKVVEDWLPAISAVRDVLIDIGDENRGIPALLEGLRGIAGGDLGRYTPGQLADMVNTTRYSVTGMGATGFSYQQTNAMQLTHLMQGRQAGITRGLEAEFARQSGHAFAATPSYFRENFGKHTLTGHTQSSFMQSAATDLTNFYTSEAMNAVGAIMHMGALAGPDSHTGRLAARIRAGELSPDEIASIDLVGLAGLDNYSPAAFTRQLGQKETNQLQLNTISAGVAFKMLGQAKQGMLKSQLGDMLGDKSDAFFAALFSKKTQDAPTLGAAVDSAVTAAGLTLSPPQRLELEQQLSNLGIIFGKGSQHALLEAQEAGAYPGLQAQIKAQEVGVATMAGLSMIGRANPLAKLVDVVQSSTGIAGVAGQFGLDGLLKNLLGAGLGAITPAAADKAVKEATASGAYTRGSTSKDPLYVKIVDSPNVTTPKTHGTVETAPAPRAVTP